MTITMNDAFRRMGEERREELLRWVGEFQRRHAAPPASPMERAFYDIFERDQRIAALEAQAARLTAPIGQDEANEAWRAWGFAEREEEGVLAALTAFLERRMKG